MTRHNLILPLEGMPGSTVKDIARDMQAAADRFGMMVSLDMNGARLLAVPGGSVADIRKDYEAQLRSADDA